MFRRSLSGNSGCDASLVALGDASLRERPIPPTLEKGNGVFGVLVDVTEWSVSD